MNRSHVTRIQRLTDIRHDRRFANEEEFMFPSQRPVTIHRFPSPSRSRSQFRQPVPNRGRSEEPQPGPSRAVDKKRPSSSSSRQSIPRVVDKKRPLSRQSIPAARDESRQNAIDARARLFEAKKNFAQSVREESMRNKVQRRTQLDEEQALRTMRSHSRLAAWEMERQHREAVASRLQKQREASEMLRKNEQLLMTHMQQQAELERLKTLKDRLSEAEAKKRIPNLVPFKFNAYENPTVTETLAEAVFRLEMARQEHDEEVAKKRSTIYERHREKVMDRLLAAAVHPTHPVTPPPKKKKRAVSGAPNPEPQIRRLIKEAREEELARLKHDIEHYKKYHGTN